MTTDSTISIAVLVALVGGFATIYNFVSAKSIRAKNDGQWQGKVDEKLDSILDNFKIIRLDIGEIREELNKLHTRVTVLEKSRTARKDTEH